MKILLLGLTVLKDSFQMLGHDVLTCSSNNTGDVKISQIPVSIDEIWQQLPNEWKPDMVMLTDESTHPLFLGLERLEVPVVWYAIDSHIHHRWHQAYSAVFDVVFVAQRDYRERYVRDQDRQSVSWLPLFCQTTPHPSFSKERGHNLSFVGSVNQDLNPERYELLERVQDAYPLNVVTGDFLPVYLDSKMVLNQCVNNDVNFRTFEAMACGSLLVMEQVGNGLEDLFEDKVHCVLYEKGNVEQILQLVRYYTLHEKERENIASQGCNEVFAHHTAVHRAQTILDTLESIDWDEVLHLRKSRQGEILSLLAPVYEYAASCYENSNQRSFNAQTVNQKWMVIAERYREVSRQIYQELSIVCSTLA